MSQRKIKQLKKNNGSSVVDNIYSKNDFVCNENSFIKIIKNNKLFLIFLVLGTLLLYLNAMSGAFVSDDYATIPNNPKVMDMTDMLGDMPSIVIFSNSVIANIFGVGSPVPFHIYSIFTYLIICVLAFVFVYLLLGKNIAWTASIIFAVLPIHVEAVSWISGKPYIFSTVFMLAALCNFLLLLKTKNRIYLWLLILFEFLAIFSDRVRFLSLFLIIAGYFVTYYKKHNINLAKFFGIIALLIGLSFIYLLPSIQNRVNVVNSGTNTSESVFYDPFFQYPTSMSKYLQLIFVPFDLTLYHTMYIFPVWLNWAILITYLANLVYFYFKNKNIFFSLAFIFLAAAPSMAPVKVSWLVAERYMFFGSLGFAMFFAIVLEEIGKYTKYLKWVLLISFVIFYSVKVVIRNLDWSTNHNLWVNTCQVSPNSHNAWNNIGDDYDKLKQYENAVKGFTQSTIVKPNYADAYHNRANIFYKVGRLDLARESYNTALTFSPSLFQTYLSLIQIDMTEKNNVLAVQHAEAAIKLQPNNPQTAYILAVVYAQVGKVDEAKLILENILKVYPDYKLAVDALNQLKIGTTNNATK